MSKSPISAARIFVVGMFDIRVVPLDQRRERIRELADQARRNNQIEDFYAFSQDMHLPFITVDSGFPVYRLNNARTKSWQLSYVEGAEGEIPGTFFDSNENLAAQKVQHEQLIVLAKKGRGEDPSIWEVLQEDKRQTQTLLMTPDGVILNGNRRLSALRELSCGKDGIEGFTRVKVAVLEDHLQEKDLLEIEARLQVAPDVRLPYDWTDEALLIMSMRDAELKDDRIAKILRKDDVDDVQALIDRFNEGRLFLKDALGEPTNLQKLVAHEQNFTELTKAIRKASSEEKDISRLLCNNVTKHGEDATRRLYDYRVLYGKDRELALLEFAKRQKIDLTQPPNGNGQARDTEDLFEDDGAEQTLLDKYAPVIERLKNPEKSKENAATLREIGDDLIDVRNNDRAKSLALSKVKRAQMLLEQVTLENADPDTFDDIKTALTAVEVAAHKLMDRIERHAIHS